MSFSVELHIPCLTGETAVFERLGEVEMGLALWCATKGLGEFTGNEMSDGEAVLYFEVSRPVKLLHTAKRLLLQHGFSGTGHAFVSRGDSFDDKERTRIELGDLPATEADLKLPRKKRRHKAVIGDYYAVPLADGRFGHVQYLTQELPWGDFIQAVNLVTEAPAALEEVRLAKPLFLPVLACVPACVAKGAWRFIGRDTTKPVRLPLYRVSMSVDQQVGRAGVYDDWFIRNITDNKMDLVGRLSTEQQRLEYLAGWRPEEIAERILTGKNKYDACL